MAPLRTTTLALAAVVLAASALGASVSSKGAGFGWPGWSNGHPGLTEPHIVGGEDAKEGEFPHQISMQIVVMWVRKSHICGGTILNSQWVLTAAHCVRGVPYYANVEVAAGKTNLGKTEASEQRSKVSKMIVHEKYAGGVGPYDIALLKLETPLTLNDKVKAAQLPIADLIPEGQSILSGWGSTSSSQIPSMPNALQKANLPLLSHNACRTKLDELAGPANNPLADTNVCTGPSQSTGLSACNGDSGGPLVQKITGKEVQVIGVVSWGYFPCGATGAPSVYTRVSAYIDWINKNMKA